jgi:hypothetical protein
MTRNLLISLTVVAAFAVGGFYLLSQNAHLPEHPLERVPSDAKMAVFIDVPALVGSSVYERFVKEGDAGAGLRQLTERCGFNPVDQLENVTAFVTGAPESLEHVGFIGEGELDHEKLAACVRDAVEADGGELRETEIEGARAVATAEGGSRAAFIGRRGVIAGHEDLVGATVRAVSGRDGNFGQDEALRKLWDRLAEHREVVAVARMPEHWQDSLRRLLGPERSGQVLPYLAELESLGASARVSRGLALTLVMVMGSDDGAAALATGASDVIDRLKRNPLVAISPAGAMISELRATATGKEVSIAFDLTQERLDSIFGFADRMLDRLSGSADPAAAGATPSGGATPPSP